MTSLVLARFNVRLGRSFSNTPPLSFFYRNRCLFHSQVSPLKRDQPNETSTSVLTPSKTYSVRRTWSQQDTEKLLYLVSKYGNRWKVFVNYFPGRTSFCIRSHYLSVKHDNTRWTLEEKKILQLHLGAEKDPNKIDWETIQSYLPRKRNVARIKQFWENSIHPLLNRGSWTKEENDQLNALVIEHGNDWETISKRIGTRSVDQCRNKWAYEVTTLKRGRQIRSFRWQYLFKHYNFIGEFTKEEDEALIKGVNKYGVDEFQKIKQEMNSKRSVSQLRTRYNNFLNPDVDRSPWTKEEKELAVGLFAELKNIRAVKKRMNSKRSIRDLYNHIRNK